MEFPESTRLSAAEELRIGLRACYKLLNKTSPSWIDNIGVDSARYAQRAIKKFVSLAKTIPDGILYNGRDDCARKVAELIDLYNEHQQYVSAFENNEKQRLRTIDEALGALNATQVKALDINIKKLKERKTPTDFSSVVVNGPFWIRLELEKKPFHAGK